MSYEPHYIAPFEQESGLNTYYEPFIIPEKAFPILEDAYIFRGRVTRRPGYVFLGRLRRIPSFTYPNTTADTTYAITDLLSTVRSAQPNAEIQAGDLSITINSSPESIYTDDGNGNIIYVSGLYPLSSTPGSSTINYLTGALVMTFASSIAGSLAVTISFPYFPTLPVMGLRTLQTSVLEDDLMVSFDTIYAYYYNSGTGFFQELAPSAMQTFSGSDYNFFWSTNYWSTPNVTPQQPWLWVTNNKDNIYYYDQTTWNQYIPYLNLVGSTYSIPLNRCLIILSFQNRLIVMNTVENGVPYPQRIRWSWIGSPDLGVQESAWVSNINGFGGFTDLTTQEAIVSAEFIKDQLIVKCERSTWKIQFVGNEQPQPFIPQKINTELGSESTFSLIPFDRGIFSIGNYGITTDDSVNVTRIDQVIPDLVFGISPGGNGLLRVQGIRDYQLQLVYWTYRPNSLTGLYSSQFPNQLLCYNYVNQTWSTWNDYYTCFGYFQNPDPLTWSSYVNTNWEAAEFTWNTFTASPLFPNVAAGNSQGFIELLSDNLANDKFYQLAGVTPGIPTKVQINNHNFGNQAGDTAFFIINSSIGITSTVPSSFNGSTYKGVVIDQNNLYIYYFDPTNPDLGFQNVTCSGTYVGGGTIQPLNGIDIWTKVFAPFYKDGAQCRLGYIDYLMDKTTSGQVTCNIYKNENNTLPINTVPVPPDTTDPNGNSGNLGYPYVSTCPAPANYIPWQQTQNKIWQRQFVQNVCQNFQIEITLNPYQMCTPSIQASDITLHAVALYISKNGRLTQ